MRNTRVVGDYRFTVSTAGLIVEVLDYHAEPLVLSHRLLRELGLAVRCEHLGPSGHERPPQPEH